MIKYFIILIISLNVKAQTIDNDQYEQIAFDYFQTIINKEYPKVRVFKYDGKIDFSTFGYNACMMPSEKNVQLSNNHQLTVLNNLIKTKLNFFNTVFINKKNVKIIAVFNSYITEYFAYVCIAVFSDDRDDYWNFQIDTKNKNIVKNCKTEMFQ